MTCNLFSLPPVVCIFIFLIIYSLVFKLSRFDRKGTIILNGCTYHPCPSTHGLIVHASLRYTRVFAVHVLLSTRSRLLALYGHHLDCPFRANLLIQDSGGNTEDQTWRFECLLVLSIMGLGKCVIYKECYKLCGPLSPFLRFGSRIFSVYFCFVRYTKLGYAGNTEPQFIIPSCWFYVVSRFMNVTAIIHWSVE